MSTPRRAPALPYMRLQAYSFDLERFIRISEDDLLDLSPAYQRGSVWTLQQRQNLIRSWLMGLPIGSIVLNDRGLGGPAVLEAFGSEAMYGLVDGKQRIEAARAWVSDEVPVPADWFTDADVNRDAVDADGLVVFSGLTVRGQRSSLRWPMPTVQSQVKSLVAEAEVFRLLNSAGTAQTTEDLARAAEVESR